MNKKCNHLSHNENCMDCQFTKIEWMHKVYTVDSNQLQQAKQKLDRMERGNNLEEYYG